MADLRLMNEIVKDIKRLRIVYPEQTRFINELEKCVTANICDTIDAKVYIYKAKALMTALFDTIEDERFDDRCITDMQYAEVISNIGLGNPLNPTIIFLCKITVKKLLTNLSESAII